MVAWGGALALAMACGGTAESDVESVPAPSAGENGDGEPNAGGSSASAGAPGAGIAGSGEGGKPGSGEGGAPDAGRGGVPAVGGATNSAGSGGAAAAGVRGIEVPEGCEPSTPIVAEQHCSVGLTCEERRLSVACTVELGLWTCACTGAGQSGTYEIPDLPSAPTCEAAAKACADPELLSGEPACERTRSGGSGSCSILDVCETWHQLGAARLRTRSEWQASCVPCAENGVLCCRCGDGKGLPDPAIQPDYRILDLDPSATCDFMDPLCNADASELAGVETCQTISQSAYIDLGCQTIARCARPVELADGTNLILSNDYTATCSQSDERSSCSCRDASSVTHYTLTWDLPPHEIETCDAVIPSCTGAEPLDLTGSPDCSPTFESLTTHACLLTRECAQPALVSGTEASVLTTVATSCNRADVDSDTWECSCSTSISSADPLDIQAPDAEDACTQAADECAKLAPHRGRSLRGP
jgi:hypothetical protein